MTSLLISLRQALQQALCCSCNCIVQPLAPASSPIGRSISVRMFASSLQARAQLKPTARTSTDQRTCRGPAARPSQQLLPLAAPRMPFCTGTSVAPRGACSSRRTQRSLQVQALMLLSSMAPLCCALSHRVCTLVKVTSAAGSLEGNLGKEAHTLRSASH